MAHNSTNDKYINDGKNTTVNQANAAIDVDPQSYSTDAAAVTALGAGFLYLDAQGNVRKSGEGDTILAPRAADGANLVINGNGNAIFSEGEPDNLNFSTLISRPDLPDGAPAAFSRSGYTVIAADNFVEINTGLALEISAAIKHVAGMEGKASLGCYFYDSSSNLISTHNYNYYPGTLTALAQDLEVGDTEIHLTDGSSWQVRTGGYHYYNRITLGNYVDAYGQNHGADGYSRLVEGIGSSAAYVSAVNGNIITLANPWNLSNPEDAQGIFRAGHPIRQSHTVSLDNSAVLIDRLLITEASGWTTYTDTFPAGLNKIGVVDPNTYPPGTTRAKFRVTFNYQGDGTTEQAIQNIIMRYV